MTIYLLRVLIVFGSKASTRRIEETNIAVFKTIHSY